MRDEKPITPYAYGKLKNMRPQVVYQWCTKQGAPHHREGGKIFIVVSEIDEWLSKKTDRVVERKAKQAEKKEGRSDELSQLLKKQRPCVVEAYCKVCGRDTQHYQEVQWSEDEYFGRYYATKCFECGGLVDVPLDPEDEGRVIEFLRDGKTF